MQQLTVPQASAVVAAAQRGQKTAQAVVGRPDFWQAVSQAQAREHTHVTAKGVAPASVKVVRSLLGGE